MSTSLDVEYPKSMRRHKRNEAVPRIQCKTVETCYAKYFLEAMGFGKGHFPKFSRAFRWNRKDKTGKVPPGDLAYFWKRALCHDHPVDIVVLGNYFTNQVYYDWATRGEPWTGWTSLIVSHAHIYFEVHRIRVSWRPGRYEMLTFEDGYGVRYKCPDGSWGGGMARFDGVRKGKEAAKAYCEKKNQELLLMSM